MEKVGNRIHPPVDHRRKWNSLKVVDVGDERGLRSRDGNQMG